MKELIDLLNQTSAGRTFFYCCVAVAIIAILAQCVVCCFEAIAEIFKRKKS